ncbi:hypothetical protein HK101_000584 [Irineochytrium annulatum]|nr:hypothetical protein HK101_000584 [Irineochytrium annulatum]
MAVHPSATPSSTPHLLRIPSELALQIFSHLSLDARLTLALASRALRLLACDASLNSQLHFHHTDRAHARRHPIADLLGAALGTLLPVGGAGVRDIDLGEMGDLVRDEQVMQVGRWCPKVVGITLSGTRVTDVGVRFLLGMYSESMAAGYVRAWNDVAAQGWMIEGWMGGAGEAASQRVEGTVPPPAPPFLAAGVADLFFEPADPSRHAFAPRCPRIERLALAGLRNITDASLKTIGASCPRLTHLDVSTTASISRLTSEGVVAVARGCPMLTSLVLSGCSQVDDQALRCLAGSACGAGLRTLELTGCFQVTDHGVREIVGRCRALEVLDLGYCWRITDGGLEGLADDGGEERMLRRLSVAFCYNISDATVAVLRDLPFLERADLFSTTVTAAGRDTLLKLGLNVGEFGHLGLMGNSNANPIF